MKKTDLPATASDKRRSPAEASVYAQVFAALENWHQWAEGTARGVLSPIQFLALVLWVLQTEDTTDEEARDIVEAWAAYLLAAVKGGRLVVVHPVTYLPIRGVSLTAPCWIGVLQLQEFLSLLPIGFDINQVLQHFRDPGIEEKKSPEVGATLDDFTQWGEVVAFRKANPETTWDFRGQRKCLRARFAALGGVAKAYAQIASELGLKTGRQSVKRAIELQPMRARSGPVKLAQMSLVAGAGTKSA